MMDRKMDDTLNDVLGQVAYQMKETMTTMYSALQRIAPADARDADAALDESAAMLTQNFYRLRRFAGNLEEAAELDSPARPIRENDDIVGLCRTVMDRAAMPAEMLGITTEFVSESSSHIIAMDAVRVERMLLNLLSNAFKFTPRGGRVTMEVRVTSLQVEIRVTDTGCGISAERMDGIFERYRTTACPDGSPSGLGLGLPICRKIAADHGGALTVLSAPGEGTVAAATLANRKAAASRMDTFIVGDYSGGFNRTLLELSDALPKEAFRNRMID